MSAELPLVLVVDDDDDTASLLAMALRRRGFRAAVAHTCAEARTLLAAQAVDALVTDISLPDGSGLELAASLEVKPRALIVVSGFGGDDDLKQSRAAEVHAHLVKPVDMARLVSTLNDLLGRPG